MTHKTEFTISQCTLSHRETLECESWASSFAALWDKYYGLPIFYPVILHDKLGMLMAVGAVIYEGGTAWVVGLSNNSSVEEKLSEFCALEVLSHLTDFCNFLQMDNVLAVVAGSDRALWHKCGYNATAILGNYSQPLHKPESAIHPSIRTIVPDDARRIQTFLSDAIHEKRNVIWGEPLSGYIFEDGRSIRGLMLTAGNAPVYADSEQVARSLMRLRMQTGIPITGVPDDNLLAKSLLAEYGCILQSEMYRLSLGRDNKWKEHWVFCGFADFCA